MQCRGHQRQPYLQVQRHLLRTARVRRHTDPRRNRADGQRQHRLAHHSRQLPRNQRRSVLVGQTVNKVGRTTGWSQGQVTNTCVNTGVSGSKIVQLCQDWVSASVGPGDSGSGVFAITSGTDVQLRGTPWGGTGPGTVFVYSPIPTIQYTAEPGPISTSAFGSW